MPGQILGNELIALLAGGTATALGILALLKGRSSAVHFVFAAGMLLFGLEQLFAWRSLATVDRHQIAFWLDLRQAVSVLLPAIWLVFSLTYARAGAWPISSGWRLVVAALAGIPLISFLLGRQLTVGPLPEVSPALDWVVGLGTFDQLVNASWLVASTLILANLERTLRASVGRFRWQTKFMVLGLAATFGLRIYTSTNALLFSALSSQLVFLEALGVLLGTGLAFIALRRSRVLDFEVYPSSTALHRSVVVVLVGVYLIAVGVVTQFVAWLGWGDAATVQAVIVFMALVLLAGALLSDRLQQGLRSGVTRHFRRPAHDYRRLWTEFIGRSTGVSTTSELARAVADMTAELFQCHSVSIWTVKDSGRSASLQASTALSREQRSAWAQVSAENALNALPVEAVVLEFDGEPDAEVAEFRSVFDAFLEESRDEYLVTVGLREELLGFMLLGQRVGNRELTLEDRELLTTLALQLASLLLSLRASDRLQKNRELETFQTVSTFFVHDLKNVASRLSLTIKNLPRHFDNPEFRDDMLRTISESVEKMQAMSGRLTPFKEGLRVQPRPIDLNAFVRQSLSTFGAGELIARIEFVPGDLPRVPADPDQLARVLENLVLNAHEASPGGASIQIVTAAENGCASIEVADSGCGMSGEFVSERLFQPFQTTKKRGMGIGLYQSRAIVEAHGGRIEVESKEGEGSRFRVVLPLTGR